MASSRFRLLPSVSSVLDAVRAEGSSTLSDEILTRAVQESVAAARDAIGAGTSSSRGEILDQILREIRALERPRLSPLINATGVIIHTNLGRAPVSEETARAIAAAARGHVPLEIEPTTNERGGRMREISTLMRLLAGAEDAIVVNNNAAAVLLTLSALETGSSVIVSRGEAVEIGGGFRVPDVLRQSGARLVEIGTTNRTYARDYEAAIDETTGALLKIHPSNFQISGFVHAASIEELAIIGDARKLPVFEDLGSGALIDTSQFGLGAEPMLGDSLAAGAAVVMASGDKLLGGPQAGIIAGKREWVDRIARHPLARAVRADKTCLAGIAATLRHYARGEAEQTVPVWRMIATPAEALRRRAEEIVSALATAGVTAQVRSCEATIGGGSLPGQILPSFSVSLQGNSIDRLARTLRIGSPAVFGRIEGDQLLLDLRTVLPELDDALLAALLQAGPNAPVG